MGQRADQIEQEICRTREDLSQNFNELQQKVKSTFDWRTQFEERPFTMVAVAFAGGMLLSAMLPSRSLRRANSGYTSRTEPCPPETKRSSIRAAAKPERRSESDALKGALVGVAANRLGGVLGELVAGFRRELHNARQKNTGSSLDAASL
jgi:hypothetical protein